MPNKDDNTTQAVKVCNHKPGDPWEKDGGCCGDLEAANQVQENQIVNQERGELMQQVEDESIFLRVWVT